MEQRNSNAATMTVPDHDETRRKRLLFRSRHRGTREMDILLGGFAEANLGRFSNAELDQLEGLLNEADDDLYAWALGRVPIPDRADSPVARSFAEAVRRRGGDPSN